MITVEYHNLWKPYSARMSFEQAMTWLQKEAVSRGIDKSLAVQAAHHILAKVALGKKYSLEGCDCGCGLTNPHSAIIHAMHRKMTELGQRMAEAQATAFAELAKEELEWFVAALNERDIAEYKEEMDKWRDEQIVKLRPWERIKDKTKRIVNIMREG